jgi:hypothetical protein
VARQLCRAAELSEAVIGSTDAPQPLPKP